MLKKILLAAVAVAAISAAAPAGAEEMKEFRIGMLGGENEADRLRNIQCLVDHLKPVLGVEKVSVFPAADYDGVDPGPAGRHARLCGTRCLRLTPRSISRTRMRSSRS